MRRLLVACLEGILLSVVCCTVIFAWPIAVKEASAAFKPGFMGVKKPKMRARTVVVLPSAVMSGAELAFANYAPMSGQSNGPGTGAAPASSIVSENAETCTWDNVGGAPCCSAVEGVGACTPLIDAPGGDADLETGLVGMSDQMLALGNYGGPVLVEGGGVSGSPWSGVDADSSEWLRQLGPGGELADAVAYYASNPPNGVHVTAMEIWWGEAGVVSDESAATVQGYMASGWDAFNLDVSQENPTQVARPAFLLMQMTDSTDSGLDEPRSAPAIGQLNAALDLTRLIYLGVPKYAYPRIASSSLHLAPAGQTRAKEYHGYVRDRIAVDANFPRAFVPSSITVNGGDPSCIDLDYAGNIPCQSGADCDAAPLAFDTTLVQESWVNMGASHGFQLFDPNPFPARIDATPTIAGTVVQVCTDKSIRTGTEIAYAYEGIPGVIGGPGSITGDYPSNRGNLRDTNQILGERSGLNLYAWAHAGRWSVSGGVAPTPNVAQIFDYDFTELWTGRSCPAASSAWVGEVAATSVGFNTGTHSCDQATTGLLSSGGTGIGNLAGEAVDGNGTIWNQAGLAIGARTATQDIWVRWAGCPLRGAGTFGIFQHRTSSTCHYSYTLTNTGAMTWGVNTNGCSVAGPASVSINLAAFVPTAGNEVWTVCDMYAHARGGGEGVGRMEICCTDGNTQACTSGSAAAALSLHDNGTIFLNHNSGLTAFSGLTLGTGLGIGNRAFQNVNSHGWPSGNVMVRNINLAAGAALCDPNVDPAPCDCNP